MKHARNHRWTTGATSVLAALCLAVTQSGAWAEPGSKDLLRETASAFRSISRNAIPAVVFIQVEKDFAGAMPGRQPQLYNDPFEFFGDDFLRRFFDDVQPTPPGGGRQPRRFRQVGQGSGFIVSKDGYILTNSHVVGDADKITVTLNGGRKVEARRIGADARSEVALIKIDEENLPFIELGDSDALEIGEWVLAIGNPFGLTETVTAGIVSAKGRSNIGIADYENFIQTDAAINPGNSGGPLIDIDGKVVGINTAIYSRGGGHIGIGFAIPVNMAREIMTQLKDTGNVVRGYLGVVIQDIDADLAQSFGLPEVKGILVSQVMPDGPAGKAGLESGDVILTVDGRPTGKVNEFRNRIATMVPDTTLALRVIRDGAELTVKALVGTLPGDEDDNGATPADDEAVSQLGFSVGDVTAEIAEQTDYERGSGVVILSVERDSAAAEAGLREGQLITHVGRKSIADAKAFRKAVAGVKQGGILLLRVQSGRGARYVTLRLGR